MARPAKPSAKAISPRTKAPRRTSKSPGSASSPAFSREEAHQSKADAIVAAAARLIHQNGVAGTSLDDVADALGITKPSVYYYVASKDELVFRCHLRIAAHQAQAIDAATSHPGPGAEKLRIFLRAYAKFVWSADSGLPRLWQDRTLSGTKRRDVNRAYFEQSDRLVEIVKGAIRDKSIRARNPTVVERALVSSILWVPIWYAERGTEYDADDVLDELLDIFFSGLSPAGRN